MPQWTEESRLSGDDKSLSGTEFSQRWNGSSISILCTSRFCGGCACCLLWRGDSLPTASQGLEYLAVQRNVWGTVVLLLQPPLLSFPPQLFLSSLFITERLSPVPCHGSCPSPLFTNRRSNWRQNGRTAQVGPSVLAVSVYLVRS